LTAATAVDGRHWKKRCAHKHDNIIVKVKKAKKENITPVDSRKGAAMHLGEIIFTVLHTGLCITKLALIYGHRSRTSNSLFFT
jgi:hypothetical protein